MAPGSPGTSLLYGPPSRRTPLSGSAPARVEARLRALLARDDLPLEDLLTFISDNRVPDGPELVELSHRAVRVAENLGEPGMTDAGLAARHMDAMRVAADTLLFRAFHRIGRPHSVKLVDRRLEDSLRMGPARHYLAGRIDRLMADPRVRRRCDTIRLRRDDILGGVSYPTHLRHSSGGGPACQDGGQEGGEWKDDGRARPPTCDACGRLFEEDSPHVARVPRRGVDEITIYGEDILLRARPELESALAGAPIAPEGREEAWQRALWGAWVMVMIRETRDMGGNSNLARPEVHRRLFDFWDPGVSSVEGRMPNFTI